MGIKYTDGMDEEKNLLVLEDENHKAVIKIKADGDIELPENDDLSDAAQDFWQAVADFVPVEKKEQIADRIMLIKAYNLLNDLQKIAEKQGEEEIDFDDFEEKFTEIRNYFYQPH